MFVNFAENINKKELQTTNESILLRGSSGTITSIQEGYVFEDKDGNRIPVKKITIEQTK
ncbi:MAG: hypothetical protein LBG59_00575 [Candidatus Peribacteria bacterium]|jgi:hypothetical protein|nr:hypothetical protein [Candidatus Peribacteria bacterium]